MNTLSDLHLPEQGRPVPSLRAATALESSLDAAAARVAARQAPRNRLQVPHTWRADEWLHADLPAGAAPGGVATGFAALDQELPGQGWPQGQLVELLVDHPGSGELSLLLPALASISHAAGTCVWVLPCQQGMPGKAEAPADLAQALPYAPALQEAGIDLARNIFVKPLTARESGWALEQSLRASHLGALIGWLPDGSSSEADFRCLRRLHLLAQRHRALVFILRATRHAQAPSPASVRLQLEHDGALLRLRLLKRRGRPLLDPIALQVHPARWNREPVAVTATRTAHNRPATAAPSLLQRVRSLAPAPAWSMPVALGH